MSEFKGTKGEWEVYNNGNFLEIKLKGQYVGQICMMPYSNAEFEKAVNSKEENEANAKLIAAAPELLKALCGLISPGSGGPLRCLKDEGFEDEVKEAQRVIEKALK